MFLLGFSEIDSLQDKDGLMLGDRLMDFQGTQSQNEGQEDQGTLERWSSWLLLPPLGSSWLLLPK